MLMKTNKLNRRDFIRLSTFASAALPITLSGIPLFANDKPKEYQFSEDNENILVLIQLQGGNDGLNTVFNLNQYDNLQSVRSNIIAACLCFRQTVHQGQLDALSNVIQFARAGC